MGEDLKVLVSITGVQSGPHGEENTIELLTEGTLSHGEGTTSITYAESEMSGMEGSQTIISILGDAVSVHRSGRYGSNFVFKKGEKCLNVYATPFGRMQMGAFPLKVYTNIGEQEGEVDLEYEIEIQGQNAGLNRLRVCYWPSGTP